LRSAIPAKELTHFRAFPVCLRAKRLDTNSNALAFARVDGHPPQRPKSGILIFVRLYLLLIPFIILVAVVGIVNASILNTASSKLFAAVINAEQADLSANGISPSSAVIGTSVPFQGTITNTGTKTTNSTFFVRYFIDNNTDHTTVPYAVAGSESVLLPGGSFTTSGNFTFPAKPASGTWYVQLCADMNSSRVGIIVESNEENNCTEWTPITVTASSPILATSTPFIQVTPTTGATPLTVSISGVVANTANSCAEATYVVFFGDATAGHNFTVPAGNCSYEFGTIHTYAETAPNINTVSLWKRDSAGTASTEIVRASKDVVLTKPTASQPDLTAGAVAPTSAVVNTAVPLSSVITNSGTTSTGGSFLNRFFIDNNADHSGSIPYVTVGSESTVASGGTFTTKGTYTFPTAGTWYVRLCSDSDASLKGIIIEKDETNNCGEWTAIVVGPSITATPTIGTAPLTVSMVVVVNSNNSCDEQGFVVFFGDGSGGSYFTVPKNSCALKTYTVSHTYMIDAPQNNTPSVWRWHRDSVGAIVIDDELVRGQDVVLQDARVSPSLYTTSVTRPENSPKLSDRVLSSRWERTGTYSTFGAVTDFFSSRIDWNYSFQAAGTFIRDVLNKGLGYSGTINGQMPDGLDALNTTRVKGRDNNVYGDYYTLPALTGLKTYVGDLSSPEYQSSVRTLVENYVTHGAKLIQIDDMGFQYNWVVDDIVHPEINRRVLGGYGTSSLEHFTKVWLPSHYDLFPNAWELPFTRSGVLQMSTTSVVESFRLYAKTRSGVLIPELQNQFYEFHKQQFIKFMDMIKTAAGDEISFSCNGGSFQFTGDEDPSEHEGIGGTPFPLTLCDFFNSELSHNANTQYSSAEPEHIWSRARHIESKGKVQIFNPPKFEASLYTTNNALIVKHIRRVIAFAYGIGSWMVAPWDVYVANLNLDAIPENLYRYFGKASEYGDLYRFVKENASYIDGYEHVYDTSSPAGGSTVVFNTPTVKGKVEVKDKEGVLVGDSRVHPVNITSVGRAYAFLRAKPHSETASAVVHLINYSDSPAITIELTNSFFNWPSNVPMTLEVRTPGSYDVAVLPAYVKVTSTGTLANGKTTFSVLVSKEYALLIVPPK
jgi:hypothetical protein